MSRTSKQRTPWRNWQMLRRYLGCQTYLGTWLHLAGFNRRLKRIHSRLADIRLTRRASNQWWICWTDPNGREQRVYATPYHVACRADVLDQLIINKGAQSCA